MYQLGAEYINPISGIPAAPTPRQSSRVSAHDCLGCHSAVDSCNVDMTGGAGPTTLPIPPTPLTPPLAICSCFICTAAYHCTGTFPIH